MIRGVDREICKAIKDAAEAEGVSVGIWLRRCLVRALDASEGDPAALMDLSARERVLGTRVSVLETLHHALHRKVHATGRLTAEPTSDNPTPCRRAKTLK